MSQDKQKSTTDAPDAPPEKPAQKRDWGRISIVANIVILVLVAVGALGMAVLHQSDTNPNFCATCHVIMDKNVQSYLTGSNLDHVHELANVQCKDCHNYPVSAEIASGIKFITGNYEVDSSGQLLKRTYDDSMCLKCHISYDYVAQRTANLDKNPHDSHLGQLPCSTCHVSHGEQIDYCATCHDHGEQQMIKAPDAVDSTTTQ